MAGTPGPSAGGIAGLVAFLRDHGHAVEADLLRFYGVHLRDLTNGSLTWRSLSVLLRGLPEHSATAREVGGPDLAWGLPEQLLAFIGDGIQVGNWQRSGGRGKPPKPTPRPGIRDAAKTIGKTTLSPAEARAYLARMRPEVSDDGV